MQKLPQELGGPTLPSCVIQEAAKRQKEEQQKREDEVFIRFPKSRATTPPVPLFSSLRRPTVAIEVSTFQLGV